MTILEVIATSATRSTTSIAGTASWKRLRSMPTNSASTPTRWAERFASWTSHAKSLMRQQSAKAIR